ncbi:MAG: DUF3127 domain-containing protein [Weeksellaceae bacterium]|nr:DUF3127 domain-containing protein [Flavobacterium sp.]
MEINGRIKKIFDEQTFGSGFRKKEIVITTQEQYPQDIIIEFTQDKISLLDSLNEGEEVKVSINIRGREWINPEGVAKYFNSINGWRVEKTQGGDLPPSDEFKQMPTTADFTKSGEDAADDLPF